MINTPVKEFYLFSAAWLKKQNKKRNIMSGLFLLLWYPVAIFEWKIETSTPETCHCSKFCIHVAFPIFGTWYLGCTGERKLQSAQEGFHNEWAATDALRHQCRGPRQRRAVDQVALALCRWEGLIFHQERRKRRKLEIKSNKDKQTGFLTSDAEKKKSLCLSDNDVIKHRLCQLAPTRKERRKKTNVASSACSIYCSSEPNPGRKCVSQWIYVLCGCPHFLMSPADNISSARKSCKRQAGTCNRSNWKPFQ